jgi:DNA-binding XRE family transcriptional regulator
MMALRKEELHSPQLGELRHDLSLSRERMARLASVSSKTIERWEERAALPETVSAQTRILFSQLQEMRDLGLTVYSAEGFRAFLRAPLPEFDGRTALQMIEQGLVENVIAALAADYEGLGF